MREVRAEANLRTVTTCLEISIPRKSASSRPLHHSRIRPTKPPIPNTTSALNRTMPRYHLPISLQILLTTPTPPRTTPPSPLAELTLSLPYYCGSPPHQLRPPPIHRHRLKSNLPIPHPPILRLPIPHPRPPRLLTLKPPHHPLMNPILNIQLPQLPPPVLNLQNLLRAKFPNPGL